MALRGINKALPQFTDQQAQFISETYSLLPIENNVYIQQKNQTVLIVCKCKCTVSIEKQSMNAYLLNNCTHVFQ